MSEMQCAGVRRDLQGAMCAMSKMQCAGVRPWDAVPSSHKTYPCQYDGKPGFYINLFTTVSRFNMVWS
jgi:hypothetical protein